MRATGPLIFSKDRSSVVLETRAGGEPRDNLVAKLVRARRPAEIGFCGPFITSSYIKTCGSA
jgi:hypothetical protein